MASRSAGMLYQNNTSPAIIHKVLGLVLAVLIAGLAVPALGQGVSRAAVAPSALDTIRAFDVIEPWVRDLAVPEEVITESVGGACVTLRLRGRVIGRGQAVGLGASTIPDAVRLAIADALPALPVINSSDADAARRLLAREISLTLELAGEPIPLDAASYTEISAIVSPGSEAVAVRLGTAGGAVLPIEMMLTSQQAGAAAARLVSGMTGDAVLSIPQPAELAEAGFFRMRTMAVAQLAPDARPEILHRGGRVVPLSAVTADSLHHHARDLVDFLLIHPGVGVYQPVNDAVLEPGTAASRALVVLAVQRSLEELELEPVARETGEVFVANELAVLRRGPLLDPAAIALAAVAIHRSGTADEATTDLIDRLVRLASVQADAGRTRAAVIAWSLTQVGREDDASAIVAELRRVEHAGQLVGMMPWLGWAELALVGEIEQVPSAVGLRQMREMVHGFQLRASDAGVEDRDMVGGVVFTSGAVPLPTWQSVRPMAFLATMLGDPRLTESNEIGPEVVAMAQGLRFLVQLTASDAERHMYRESDQAMGGVRAAVWDQSMPIEASALTLMTLLEAIESLRKVDRRDAAAEPVEPVKTAPHP